MTALARWWTRLRLRVWRRAGDDRDLDDEIRFHLAQEAQRRMQAGAGADDAVSSARHDFGNIGRIKEVTRAMRTWTTLETLGQDLRFGVRLLARSRAFSLFSILSLALGIGATTAIFSLFDAIVLRPLPVKEPDRLALLSFAAGGTRPNNFLTYPLFARLHDANTTLDGLFAWMTRPRIGAVVDGRTEIVSSVYVSGGYYRTLGIQPALGRFLTPDDDRPGNATSVVLSDGYWRRRFARDPSVIGSRITLDSVPYTIVGIEPRGFVGVNMGSAPDVVFPLRASHSSQGPQPWDAADWTWIEVIGRLKPGVSIDRAQQELTSIFRGMDQRVPARTSAGAAAPPPPTVFVQSGAQGGNSPLRRNYGHRLRLMLMMLSALVLLASLNLATLLLARSEARRSEMAMRLALGAGRWRLVRQLLTESVLLAAAGGTLGLLSAWWGSQALLRVAVRDTADLAVDLTPDARMLAVTLLMSVGTCLFFGLLPAVRATAGLHSASRHEAISRRRRRLERTLVATQTALSLVLLVFAALFVRSLQNLWTRDPGYVRTNVSMFSTDARLAGKKGDAVVAKTYRDVLDALRGLPGVRHASISTVAPVSTSYYFVDSVTKLGESASLGDKFIRVATNFLSPGYFETLGIPLVAGRDFDLRDDATAPKVVVISERLASKFAGPAVGQSLTWSGGIAEVVGIARDNRYGTVKDAPRDVLYFPMFQSLGVMRYGPTFEIRHEGSTAAMFRSIRDSVAAVDPALTIFRLNTLEDYTRESLSQERLMAMSGAYVGGFALLLASIGLYGLLMYAVVQRTPELGLRMALGSTPAGVRRLVLMDSAGTVIAGLVLGFCSALWLARFAQGQLVDLEPLDPGAFGIATLVLLSVALAAVWLPALRASRIDPIIALRHE